MRIRPQHDRPVYRLDVPAGIDYGFLLGVMVTVDVLLMAAIFALHRLQAWLAL